MKNYIVFESPIGPIYLISEQDCLVGVYFKAPHLKNNLDQSNQEETPFLKKARQQLREYFSGKRRTFDLKIKISGTDFQKKAWQGLQKIPFGKTQSYTEQAQLIGNAQAIRAIGTANSKNPISIIVPCHRVIRNDGSLGGYAGGLAAKKFLLQLEQN